MARGEFDYETIETVSRNFYVDDCLKSVATTEEAVRLSSQWRGLLSRGGFRLTKWISNDRNLIASVPMTERAPSVNDETQRGLTGSISKKCGVKNPAFLSYFSFAPDGE